jgi:hypothetical protein
MSQKKKKKSQMDQVRFKIKWMRDFPDIGIVHWKGLLNILPKIIKNIIDNEISFTVIIYCCSMTERGLEQITS